MSTKSKGTNAERVLLHKFYDKGWQVMRSAGSGSIGLPSPDLIAGNGVRKLVIEVKTINDVKKYFTKNEIDELILFAKALNAEPWVAIKFMKNEWLFLNIEDLEKTEKSYAINAKKAKMKGLSFEQLIE